MLSRTCCFALQGVEGVPVTVEAYVSGGQFAFTMVGLPDAAVRESRERVYAAMKNNGFTTPSGHVTVNLSPADLRKEGTAFDLPIAVAIIIATRQIRAVDASNILLLGELALDGRLVPVRGALPLVLSAHEHGIREVILPAENAHEVQAVQGMLVYPAHTLYEAVMHLTGAAPLLAQVQKSYDECLMERTVTCDLSSVRGQTGARRALEVAAAGGHNMLMVGVPGSGKTMLARCLPGILPQMTLEEACETTRIQSVAGLLPPGAGLMTERPFRTPPLCPRLWAAAPTPCRAKSPWRIMAYCSWTSCRSIPARRWRRCASRWRTACAPSPVCARIRSICPAACWWPA